MGDQHVSPRSRLPVDQPAEAVLEEDQPAFAEILALLSQKAELDFALYKPAAVARGLDKRLRVLHLDSGAAYLHLLRSDAGEAGRLAEELLIGVTRFFRDPAGLLALQAALRAYLQARPPARDPLRAWVCGCSSGEEAFTVAVALAELLAAEGSPRGFWLFATDVNLRAVARAAGGRYPASVAADIPPDLLARHFVAEPGAGYGVRRELRDRVRFSCHNLLRDPPFTDLDLVCCRNVLIYLNGQAHAQVARTFAAALAPGGLLSLGESESLAAEESGFELIDSRWRIFRTRDPGSHPPSPPHPPPPGERAPRPTPPREPPRRVTYFESERPAPPPAGAVEAEVGPPSDEVRARIRALEDELAALSAGGAGAGPRPRVAGVAQHLLRALEESGLSVALLDQEGRMSLATSSFADLFHRDPRWLEGTSASSLLRPADRARFQAAFARARNGETWTGQFLIEVPGGDSFVERVRLTPLRDPQGEIRGVLRVSQLAARATGGDHAH